MRRHGRFPHWIRVAAGLSGEEAVVVLFHNTSSRYIASQFEKLTPIGSAEARRFGYYINGFDLYYAENYQPREVEGLHGS